MNSKYNTAGRIKRNQSIVEGWEGGMTSPELSKKFDLSKRHIYKIIKEGGGTIKTRTKKEALEKTLAFDMWQKYGGGLGILLRFQALEMLGGKCIICGEDDWRVLQVDHVEGGGGAERKKISNRGIYRKVRDGATGYQCLCANCNWRKRWTDKEYIPVPKLTENDVIEIRRLHATKKLTLVLLGKMFKVSPENVGFIVRKLTWSHL